MYRACAEISMFVLQLIYTYTLPTLCMPPPTQGMMERVGTYIAHQNFCDGEDLARGRPGKCLMSCTSQALF